MKTKRGKRGSSTVEAAILFPLIILFAVEGLTLMTDWYSQWKHALENHVNERKEKVYSPDEALLHWEQWGELLEDSDE